MAWGGAPPGSPFAGPTGAGTGLPFAGIPEELRERAERILEREPDHAEPEVIFEQVATAQERSPFTLRRFLAPRKRGLAVAFLLVVVETIALQSGPLLTQIAIDHGILAGDFATLGAVAVAYMAGIAVSVAASGARIAYTGRLGELLLQTLRIRVFTHLQRLSLDFFTREKAGRVMTRMTSDIDALVLLFQDGLVNLAVQGLTLVVITAVLFAMSPTLAVVTVGVVVPVMLVLTIWFHRASERGYGAVRERIAEVMADLQESLSGIRIITAHNRRRHNVVHHDNVIGAHREANVHTARIGAVYGPATEGLGILGQALVLGVGGWMVLQNRLTLGELTAFVLYLTAFFAPIQQLVALHNTYQQGQAAVAKLRDLLAEQPSVPEAPDAVELPPVRGTVELDDVCFAYEPGGREVLTGIDLRVEAGETFALVGPTGAGKSTIAKLVARFYDPTSGCVRIDGHDLRDVTFDSLRRQLGLVPQEPFLFHGTIRDNVTFARPEAPDDEVAEACMLTGLDELVGRLPEGLDTPVHERGASLSSGERQLLALTRALLARPRILVLDEATSNLDLQSEAMIERALDAVLEGRTAILVAHRLATAMRADRIGVVEEGRLVEVGSHEDLIGAGGTYASLFEAWQRHAGRGDE